MKYLSIIVSAFLFSCAPKPTATTVSNWERPENIKFTVKKGIDNVFGNVMQFAFMRRGVIKNQFKYETSATVIIEIENACVSYLDRKTKKLVDTSALLVVALERRVSNNIYVYPKEGTLQVVVLLNKNQEGNTDIIITMAKTCILTAWMENHYLERRRKLKNVPAKTTSKLENEFKDFILSF